MSLSTRLARMEHDMKWLKNDAWFDRIEHFLKYQDALEQVLLLYPQWREKWGEEVLKPPPWLDAVLAWHENRMGLEMAQDKAGNCQGSIATAPPVPLVDKPETPIADGPR